MSVNVAGGDLQWNAGIDLSQFNQDIQSIRNGLNSLTDNQKKQGADLEDFAKKAAAAAAGYFSIQAAKDFVVSMVQVRGEFQQIEVAYRTMLGSKEKADKLMAESVKLAAVTPFGLQDVASGSKQLLAYGFAAQDITKNLEMLGNIASGVGSQLNDVVYLYGTLKASGRVTQMDINQFAGRGIPIYQALADTMKINVEQVREYVSAGKVGFPQVEAAFNKLTGAGGQFFNLMQEQSKTLTGQLSNLEDAWAVMLNDLGKQNEGVFASAIGGAITLIENYQEVIDILASVVAGYGAYRAALLVTAATTSIATYATTGFTAAEILQYYWTTTLTKAQKLLNATMLANPYVAVAAALAALGTYLYLTSENALKLKTASELTTEAMARQGDAVETAESKLRVYIEMLRNTNLSETERVNIYNKIKSIDPSIVRGIDEKTISYGKLKTSVDAYIVSLRQKFAAEANEGAIKSSIEQENALRKAIEERERITNAYLSQGLTRKDITDKSPAIQRDILKQENDARNLLLKQQIETNKLIGKSVQTGSKEQIAAAEKDLQIIQSQKKLYAKGTIEFLTIQQQAVEKQEEINELRKLKQKADNPVAEVQKTSKNKAYYEAIVKDNTEKLEALDKGEKDFSSKAAPLKKRILDAQKELLSFSTNEKAAKKANDEMFQWSEKRIEILDKISEAYNKANSSAKTQNQQEIEANQAKYKSLRDELAKYNREAKKSGRPQLGNETAQMINNAELKEDYSIKYKQDTEKQSIEFEKQKNLYEDFENYKTTFGKVAAEKRYGTELRSYDDLLNGLKASYSKLAIKSVGPLGLTGGEKERLDNEEKQIKSLQEIEASRYAAAYESALTYNQNIERINAEYRDKAKKLEGKITDEQKQVLLKKRDDAISAASDEAIAKTDIYKRLAEQTLDITQAQVKEQAKALKELLKDDTLSDDLKSRIQGQLDKVEFTLKIGVNQSNLDALKLRLHLLKDSLEPSKNGGIIISPDETKRTLRELTEIQAKIDKIINPSTGKANSSFTQGLKSQYDTSSKVADKVSKDLGQLSGGFSELSSALGGVDTKAGYALDTVAKLAQVGSDAAGAFSSFASGDIIGGITKTISAVAGLFSIGKKVKEMNAAARKEVADFYASAISGEREYQDMLKQRELQTIRNNKIALQGIRDELALRRAQNAEYAKESAEIMAKLQGQSYISAETYTHGTWFRKASVDKTYSSLRGMSFEQLSSLLAQGKLEGDAKALVERLKELEQKGYDATAAMADLAKETQEIFTGTTADSLTDSLLDMFKAGKTGVTDLAEFFKSTMDDAALSIFKNKVLAEMMSKFYDEFSTKAQSGDELTDSEIKSLQTLFTSLTDDAKAKFEALKKVTGSNLSDGPSKAITGIIASAGLTEDSANKAMGIWRGQYDLTKTLVKLSNDSVAHLMSISKYLMDMYNISVNTFNLSLEIRDNTLRTANNTDNLNAILLKIEKNTSGGSGYQNLINNGVKI
ncbi:tape measure protein [Pedobacter sp. Leaf170]|uniref:tape measure protein n=1 Tax=Pedobacter sp. Leaf170 TaxID=2876558 RepID=UPI001E2EA732|nr:tape measure protein [Pedobacter sp. Leaf170]